MKLNKKEIFYAYICSFFSFFLAFGIGYLVAINDNSCDGAIICIPVVPILVFLVFVVLFHFLILKYYLRKIKDIRIKLENILNLSVFYIVFQIFVIIEIFDSAVILFLIIYFIFVFILPFTVLFFDKK